MLSIAIIQLFEGEQNGHESHPKLVSGNIFTSMKTYGNNIMVTWRNISKGEKSSYNSWNIYQTATLETGHVVHLQLHNIPIRISVLFHSFISFHFLTYNNYQQRTKETTSRFRFTTTTFNLCLGFIRGSPCQTWWRWPNAWSFPSSCRTISAALWHWPESFSQKWQDCQEFLKVYITQNL